MNREPLFITKRSKPTEKNREVSAASLRVDLRLLLVRGILHHFLNRLGFVDRLLDGVA